MKLLFVCTGNTCRSPMAQVLAQSLGYSACSAGVFAHAESPASENALLAMQHKKLDLSAHKAQQLAEPLLQDADIVLTMTAGHKSAILQNFAEYSAKTYTLGEYVDELTEICDPFGGDLETYRQCAEEILSLLEKISTKIDLLIQKDEHND